MQSKDVFYLLCMIICTNLSKHLKTVSLHRKLKYLSPLENLLLQARDQLAGVCWSLFLYSHWTLEFSMSLSLPLPCSSPSSVIHRICQALQASRFAAPTHYTAQGRHQHIASLIPAIHCHIGQLSEAKFQRLAHWEDCSPSETLSPNFQYFSSSRELPS